MRSRDQLGAQAMAFPDSLVDCLLISRVRKLGLESAETHADRSVPLEFESDLASSAPTCPSKTS